MRRTSKTLLAAAAIFAGCSPTIVDIRPYPAYPDQTLEAPDLVLATQHGIRVTMRYMRPEEMNEAFPVAGDPKRTGNPFLHHPPVAGDRYTVFRITVRNESQDEAFMDFSKIKLLDEKSVEFRPANRKDLFEYWMKRIKVRPNRTTSWGDQINAISALPAPQDKKVFQPVYEGGRIPVQGEQSGYIGFPNVPDTVREYRILVEGGILQSRYGNPTHLALMEFHFKRENVPVAPPEAKEMEKWR